MPTMPDTTSLADLNRDSEAGAESGRVEGVVLKLALLHSLSSPTLFVTVRRETPDPTLCPLSPLLTYRLPLTPLEACMEWKNNP